MLIIKQNCILFIIILLFTLIDRQGSSTFVTNIRFRLQKELQSEIGSLKQLIAEEKENSAG